MVVDPKLKQATAFLPDAVLLYINTVSKAVVRTTEAHDIDAGVQ
jgi:hypothetical protein